MKVVEDGWKYKKVAKKDLKEKHIFRNEQS